VIRGTLVAAFASARLDPARLSFAELSAYFASLRAAFSNLRIVREQIMPRGFD